MKPRAIAKAERGEAPPLSPEEKKWLREKLQPKQKGEIKKLITDLEAKYQKAKREEKGSIRHQKLIEYLRARRKLDRQLWVHETDKVPSMDPKKKRPHEGLTEEEMKKLRRLQQIKKDRNRSLTPAQAKELKRLLELR